MTETTNDNSNENDPNNWIWGLFYYNPEDRRLFPPKKNAWMGWTVNFANPKSVIAFLIILLIIVVLGNLLNGIVNR